MRWLVDLFVQVRASSLGQDAVIEIMIALLGIMIAVLTLVAGLITLLIAVAAFYGYSSLKDQVVQAALQRAEEIATKVARESAGTVLDEGRLKEQVSSIVEAVRAPARRKVATQSPKRPMLGDADLKKGKGDSNDRSRRS